MIKVRHHRKAWLLIPQADERRPSASIYGETSEVAGRKR